MLRPATPVRMRPARRVDCLADWARARVDRTDPEVASVRGSAALDRPEWTPAASARETALEREGPSARWAPSAREGPSKREAPVARGRAPVQVYLHRLARPAAHWARCSAAQVRGVQAAWQRRRAVRRGSELVPAPVAAVRTDGRGRRRVRRAGRLRSRFGYRCRRRAESPPGCCHRRRARDRPRRPASARAAARLCLPDGRCRRRLPAWRPPNRHWVLSGVVRSGSESRLGRRAWDARRPLLVWVGRRLRALGACRRPQARNVCRRLHCSDVRLQGLAAPRRSRSDGTQRAAHRRSRRPRWVAAHSRVGSPARARCSRRSWRRPRRRRARALPTPPQSGSTDSA
jgi:hypothetical protein